MVENDFIKQHKTKYMMGWYRRNRSRWNAIQYKSRTKRRDKLIDFLGGKCNRCGFDDRRALQLDHINGGGQKEVQRIGSTLGLVCFYMKNLDLAKKNLQVLCANCNWIKKAEKGENCNYLNNKKL